MKNSLCTDAETAPISRRDLLNRFGLGLGGIALASLLSSESADAEQNAVQDGQLSPRAKRVIFLFQSGAPSHTAKVADDLCIVKTVNTEAINHGPGVTMMQTGSQFPGRPSMGSWLWYGLGSANEDLPAFVVMVSTERGGQPLVSRLWGSGFLPRKFDGVRLRPDNDAVLYLNSPPGIDRASHRKALDRLRELHELQLEAIKTKSASFLDQRTKNEVCLLFGPAHVQNGQTLVQKGGRLRFSGPKRRQTSFLRHTAEMLPNIK